jgi:hypothetical protein
MSKVLLCVVDPRASVVSHCGLAVGGLHEQGADGASQLGNNNRRTWCLPPFFGEPLPSEQILQPLLLNDQV